MTARAAVLPPTEAFDPAPPARSDGVAADRPADRPATTVTLGDFRIVRRLGAGAVGTVYLAHQVSRSRQVALKVLGDHVARRPGYLARFRREAAVLDRLCHPGIVRGYGIGEEQGFHYFAMEHVDGASAADVLRRAGAGSARPTPCTSPSGAPGRSGTPTPGGWSTGT